MQTKKPRQFYPGLEYLRLLLIALVIGWHLQVFGVATFYSTPTPLNIMDFVYFAVFLLGVPGFLIVSQFLYVQNRRKGYLGKRLIGLAVFSLFWNIVAFAMFANQANLQEWISPMTIILGGFEPLYFMMVLIVLTAITELICRTQERFDKRTFMLGLYVALGVFLLLVELLPYVLQPGNFVTNYLLSFRNAFIFIPYSILGFILATKLSEKPLAKQPSKREWYLFGGLFATSVVVSLGEYMIAKRFTPAGMYQDAFPVYSRVGLVIGAVALLLLFLRVSNAKYDGVVRNLTALIGGVYIIHFLIIRVLKTQFVDFWNSMAGFELLLFVAITAASFGIAWVIKTQKLT